MQMTLQFLSDQLYQNREMHGNLSKTIGINFRKKRSKIYKNSLKVAANSLIPWAKSLSYLILDSRLNLTLKQLYPIFSCNSLHKSTGTIFCTVYVRPNAFPIRSTCCNKNKKTPHVQQNKVFHSSTNNSRRLKLIQPILHSIPTRPYRIA